METFEGHPLPDCLPNAVPTTMYLIHMYDSILNVTMPLRKPKTNGKGIRRIHARPETE